MKYKELTTKSREEVAKDLLQAQAEMLELRVKVRLNQADKNHKVQILRRDIARMKTFLNTK